MPAVLCGPGQVLPAVERLTVERVFKILRLIPRIEGRGGPRRQRSLQQLAKLFGRLEAGIGDAAGDPTCVGRLRAALAAARASLDQLP